MFVSSEQVLVYISYELSDNMNIGRVFTGGLFVSFLFFTAMDIQDLAVDGSLALGDYDFGEYSFLWLVFDVSILFSAYHDTWIKGRKK